jgi:dyslexia susceptibility 1 candidate gene 1 protein
MPITIKDYSSIQSPNTVHVNMKCPIFFATKNVDIFHSDKYVKVSHPPYIFELFFEQKVKVSETRCLIQGTCIDFELFKEEEIVWKDLNVYNFELR